MNEANKQPKPINDSTSDVDVVYDMFYEAKKDPDASEKEWDVVMDSMVENHNVDGPGQLPNPTKLKRKRGRPEKVSKDVFTEAWNNCSSLKEVAELLGVPALSASVKASNLRKSGRQLKLYKRGAKRKTACV